MRERSTAHCCGDWAWDYLRPDLRNCGRAAL